MSSEIAEKLSRQTSKLVSEFEKRLEAFAQRDDLLGMTIRLDPSEASSLAREYFGEGEHNATGIDGSRGFDERLQMMLFYSNATAYSSPFYVGKEVTFDLKNVRRDARLSATSAIPLWSEDILSVMPYLREDDLELEHLMERIPNAFMTMAELYLALKATERSRVVFLDRLLSGTYATLSRDYNMMLKGGTSELCSLEFDGTRLSMLDLRLGLSLGAPEMPLPSRPRFFKYSVLRALMNYDLSTSQIASAFSFERKGLERAIRGLRKLDKDYGGALLSDSEGDSVKVRQEVKGYWERITAVLQKYAESVFEAGNHPLEFSEGRWLTILDVSALTLLLLQDLYETARKRKVLLIGIAKDTTATDINRAALPFAIASGYISPKSEPPRLNNDKAFLAIFSSTNLSVKTPWRTFGYDHCYSTIVHRAGEEPAFGPARRVVARERLFVRGFFQLRTLRTDPHLRSSVFFFDRLYDERYDLSETKLETVEGGEVIEINPYFEPKDRSRLSNLVLYILSLADNPEVSEAFGHNQLLYLADKAVKAEVRLMRGSLRGVADLRVGSMSRRRQVSGIVSTFREQRHEAEGARSRGASGYGD